MIEGDPRDGGPLHMYEEVVAYIDAGPQIEELYDKERGVPRPEALGPNTFSSGEHAIVLGVMDVQGGPHGRIGDLTIHRLSMTVVLESPQRVKLWNSQTPTYDELSRETGAYVWVLDSY